jgi:cobalt-zinc-cadmium efflux system outer membrane protein
MSSANRWVLVFLVAGFLCSFGRRARAEPLLESELLTVLDLRQPALQIAEAERARAAGQRLGASAVWDPRLEAKSEWTQVKGSDWGTTELAAEQQLPLAGLTLRGAYRAGVGDIPWYYSEKDTASGGEASVQLVLPLLEGRATDSGRTGLAVGELEVSRAEARLAQVRIELRRDARVAYWVWVAAVGKLRIARELLAVGETRDVAVQSRIRSGDLAPIAALDNRKTVLERRADLALLEQKVAQSALKLSLYLRDGEGVPRVVTENEAPLLPEPPNGEPSSLETLLVSARERRPELREARQQLAQIEAEIRLARAEVLPSVDLMGRLAQDLGEGTEKQEKMEMGVGVQLKTSPIQRKARGKLEELTAKRAASEQKLRLVEDKIVVEVGAARAAVLATAAAWGLATEGADAAIALAEAERERFAAGDTDLLSVYLREQAMGKAIGEQVEALAAWHIALADLDAAIGGG